MGEATAVVTGAASGIGQALAARFASDGMNVLLADVNGDGLRHVADELRSRASGAIVAQTVDVTDADQVEGMAIRAWDEFGRVDVLCNNAGTTRAGAQSRLWEAPVQGWRDDLELNFFGALHGVRAFVPRLLAQDHDSHIVNTSSMAGITPNTLYPPYGAAKHALLTMTEDLAMQLADLRPRVRVSALLPGPTDTPAYRNSEARGRRRAPDGDSSQVLGWVGESEIVMPQRSADLVAAAIGTDRIWIFTNAGSAGRILERFDPLIAEARRLDDR
jgi:NAD(P)-dependent dehydrogenase (short-subunit alcohol dehydrogenase family)